MTDPNSPQQPGWPPDRYPGPQGYPGQQQSGQWPRPDEWPPQGELGFSQGQPGFGVTPGPRKKQLRRGVKIIGAIIYTFLVLMIGVAIGSSTKSSGSSSAGSGRAGTTTHNSPASQSSSAPAHTTQPAPASHVLIRFAGSGIRNSAPFNVGSSPLTITYTFNCSATGGQGNFIADLVHGNQSSPNSDDQSIANDLASHGGQTTTVYPTYPGKDYYLSVNSECSWRVKVVGS